MKKSARNQINFGSSHLFTNLLTTIFVLFVLFCMICNPAKYIEQSLSGISAWAFNVLPSVLPFMFFTKILSSIDTMSKISKPFSKLSQRFFATPPISIYCFVMAILSGYPVGTKMVADLFLQGKITKKDAFKMTSFCSTSGPMFIIGAVGVGMFKSSKIGYILFLSHFFGALLNGILFKNINLNPKETNKDLQIKQNKTHFDISDIVLNSTLSILSVGCIITIFFIIIECFSPVLNLLPPSIAFFLEGVIEITKGCIDISSIANIKTAILMASFVISFGGFSTILQSITMLSSIKMPTKLFILQKFTHAVFSTLVTILLLFVIK